MNINFPADAPAMFWFRRDLRLADNPGLTEAQLIQMMDEMGF